ncbi:TlpA family protein disulfide reductase [Peptostreptococcus faecalis]|uniref:TlpA family protein disulfide reductase n=1 Tax=Peptostreptococcus faecalis TaxID=2045015 RepID=UPI000C7CE608|nr:TlpA disulfide reductase family protein [Peptostreptococcus faecalis]
MRKLAAVLLSGVILLGATGCSSEKKDSDAKETKVATTTISKFDTKDVLTEEKINNEVFKGSKLTLVNIWGTFCAPCMEELPYLQELNDEYKDKNIAVLGIVQDGESAAPEAIKILKKLNITFKNIIPDENLNKGILSNIDAVPVTIVVDENGSPVSDMIFGSKTKEEYKKIIDDSLAKIEKK